MKHTESIMPLYTPDIMEYIARREAVCQLVLQDCKQKSIFGDVPKGSFFKYYTEGIGDGSLLSITIFIYRGNYFIGSIFFH